MTAMKLNWKSADAYLLTFALGLGLALISFVPQRDNHWVTLGMGLALAAAGLVAWIMGRKSTP